MPNNMPKISSTINMPTL